MRKKRVLLLSEGFGAGHTQAAQALSVSLRMLSPDIQTRVLELGSFLNPTLAPWILTAYRKTVTTQPKLYGIMYRSQYKKSLNRFAQLALHRIFYAQTAAVVHQLRPDAIVCTHPIPNAVISRLKRAGLNVPLCTVITDYDAHGTWISSEVNKYLVSTSNVRDQLLQRGVQPEAIQVTGIPVHPNFWEPHNREELRSQFGLKAMPTVLVMGGGWGLMNTKDSLNHFTGWREKIQLIICLGSNDKALDELSHDERFQHENIRLMGFTREVDKWMEVSDLLITKPGGMTCTEGLSKGIPMLFYQPIPGQEEENMDYFTQHGYGEPIKSDATIDRWFQQLIDRYSELSKARSNSASHSHDYHPADCSQAIMEMLRVNVSPT
ncbi:processive 1,2-diacylglycerol beta-glucosyltransferase [Paenibacillus sp. 1_12]|uniref:MGDG synthase family glycosyltransferase n=1 Tax=Paenibacillus sp. 1_12 TaxID=1566278 RepID=UPI0008DFC05C|nr:glycosyltransferase [Paenibacillus sp. 1_12]SFL64138.1 processive 1,2-diacylglycerol beta-glucosyltransferase [Paenibacillus sp. 1_12]